MNTGVRNTQIAITINLLIATLMILGLSGSFAVLINLISNWLLNISIAILALYTAGYLVGKRLFHFIQVKKYNSIILGSLGLFLILLIGIISGSTVGFVQEGMEQITRGGVLSEALFDYYVKPLYWIVLYGFIPTLLAGAILGYSMK